MVFLIVLCGEGQISKIFELSAFIGFYLTFVCINKIPKIKTLIILGLEKLSNLEDKLRWKTLFSG